MIRVSIKPGAVHYVIRLLSPLKKRSPHLLSVIKESLPHCGIAIPERLDAEHLRADEPAQSLRIFG